MKRRLMGLVASITLLAAVGSYGSEGSLERREILDGRVSLLVPKSFQPPPEQELRMKYPGANRPSFVLEDESGSVNLAFDVKDVEVTVDDLEDVNGALEQQFKDRFPTATWLKGGVVQINGHPFALLDFYRPAVDMSMRNMMVATALNGRLLLVTFNYPKAKDEQWEETAKSVISSIVINKK